MQHEHGEYVAAAADAEYTAIADVSNLPTLVSQMTAARSAGDGRFVVDARYGGHEQRGGASFSADETQRRVEWSAGNG
ncbi:MAG: hypothetical protein ACYDA6_02590 [Solirubrobacteraceae bacterium]